MFSEPFIFADDLKVLAVQKATGEFKMIYMGELGNLN